MKISTRGRYALRLMLELAIYNTGNPISVRDIASRQHISDKYLEQIIAILNKVFPVFSMSILVIIVSLKLIFIISSSLMHSLAAFHVLLILNEL